MKYPFPNRQIKAKILLGILVVISAIVAASAFTYHSFNQMLQAMDTLSKPEAKLVHLNEVMTEISIAEGSARAYSLTKERHYLHNYWEQFSTINARIQRLQQDMQGNPYQLARIDSVSALLNEKQSNLRSFLKLKDKEAKKTPLKKALEIIDQKAQDVPSDPQPPVARVRPKIPHQEGYPIPRSAPTKRQPRQQANLSPNRLNSNQADELLDDVKDIISDIESEDSQMKEYLGKQELDIIEQDWLIMDQIRSIIRRCAARRIITCRSQCRPGTSHCNQFGFYDHHRGRHCDFGEFVISHCGVQRLGPKQLLPYEPDASEETGRKDGAGQRRVSG